MKMKFTVYGYEQVAGKTREGRDYSIHQLFVTQVLQSDNTNSNRLVVAGGFNTQSLRCNDSTIRKLASYKGDFPLDLECEVTMQLANGNTRLSVADVTL